MVTTRRVLLVRHGAADYDAAARLTPRFDGARYDFAPLSADGVRQVEQLVPVLRPRNPSLIVSSPYTRTLQTAATLAGGLGCRIAVDLDLHDWLPLRSGLQPISPEVVAAKIAEYEDWRRAGSLPADRTWETDDEMRSRLLDVIQRYRLDDGLVIVTHEAVIKSVVSGDVPLASRHEIRV